MITTLFCSLRNKVFIFNFILIILVIIILITFNSCSIFNSRKQIIDDKSVIYKCDLQRTGVFKGENPKLKGEVLWSFETEKEETDPKYIERRSSPIIFEDILYIGNIDHNMYAIDANTGKLKWSFKTDGPITSSPALWNRTLYFGSEDGTFYAVNIDTHKLRWKYRTDGPIYSSPAIAERMVFFGSTDGTFYALDALTGEERWEFDTKQTISCNPVVVQNYVVGPYYIGYEVFFVSNPRDDRESSKIFALNMKTGEKIWHLENNKGGYFGNLCIVNNYIYVGFFSPLLVQSGKLSCKGVISVEINSETGWFVGFFPCHDYFSGSYEPSNDDSDPSCNGNTLCFGSLGGIVYAINIGNPREIGEKYQDYVVHDEYIWEYKVKSYSRREIANASVTSLAFSGDGEVVYFGDCNGYLHAVETNTGKEMLLLNIGLIDEDDPLLLEFKSVVSFPLLYKNKLYLYVCKQYRDPEDEKNLRQVGVLYCIQ